MLPIERSNRSVELPEQIWKLIDTISSLKEISQAEVIESLILNSFVFSAYSNSHNLMVNGSMEGDVANSMDKNINTFGNITNIQIGSYNSVQINQGKDVVGSQENNVKEKKESI